MQTQIKSVCVFCGSSSGENPEYLAAAETLGKFLAANLMRLVYGGASIGVMGRIADTVLDGGGEVVGIIPELLQGEVAYAGLTKLHVTRTMHERKAMMFEMSDAFIAMPGGLGTLEEIFEVLTWAQLGYHAKPCGLLNTAGYYDKMLEFLDHSVREKFVRPENINMLLVDDTPEKLFELFKNYHPVKIKKWLDPENIQ